MGKTYRDLRKEVWETGICSGCGACTGVCPADAIIFPEGEGGDHPLHTGYCKEVDDSVECGACYAACPRTEAATEEGTLGSYEEIISAQAAFAVPGRQSGGAVTAILRNAFEEGLIDGVITVGQDPWTLEPHATVITDREAIVRHAGSRYSWWVPTLAVLKEAVIRRHLRKIAVVGVPCVASAVRALRSGDNDLLKPYGEAVRLSVGLFCTESFDYRKLVQEVIRDEYRIENWEIRQMDIRGVLEITTLDDRKTEIPLKALEACVRPGCHHCTDLTAEDADISAGSIGSPKDYTTLIIRNSRGSGFVERAVKNGLLVAGDSVDKGVIEKLAEQKRG